MTVTSSIRVHSYIPGAAMLPEALQFRYLSAAHIRVTDAAGAVQIAGTDYEIAGDGRIGTGTVRTLRAYGAGIVLTATRMTPREQSASLVAFAALPAATLEYELDRRAMIETEIDSDVSAASTRTLRVIEGQLAVPYDKSQFIGKYFYGGVNGDLIPAAAVGGDAMLRADLLSSAGSTLVMARGPDIGAVMRSVQDYFSDRLNLMDFIPANLRAGCRNFTGVVNVGPYIQAWCDALAARGGGWGDVPLGRYYSTQAITLPRNTTIMGQNHRASYFYFAYNGDGIRSIDPINGSTSTELHLFHLGVVTPNQATNTGVGFLQQAGTYITATNCRFSGFKYDVALDQSELTDFVGCHFEHANSIAGGAALWLLAGGELNAASLAGFTNRISISRSQFNVVTNAYCVRDDGGNDHAFVNNNYNGGLSTFWCCGVANIRILGGEFESAAQHCVVFSNLAPTGVSKGQCAVAAIENCELISNNAAYESIKCVSLGTLCFTGNYASNPNLNGTVNLTGNTYHYIGYGNTNAYSAPITFAGSTVYVSLDQTAGSVSVGANGGFRVGANKVVGARGAAIANAVNAAALPTNAEFNALVTQFNLLLAAQRTHGLIA